MVSSLSICHIAKQVTISWLPTDSDARLAHTPLYHRRTATKPAMLMALDRPRKQAGHLHDDRPAIRPQPRISGPTAFASLTVM